MAVQKQVDYWSRGSLEDMEAADVLLERQKPRHALFFAHLSVEKILKAHVARASGDIPPRIHNLGRLAQISCLTIGAEDMDFLLRFDAFQMEGRYPEQTVADVSPARAGELVTRAKEIRTWLMRQL